MATQAWIKPFVVCLFCMPSWVAAGEFVLLTGVDELLNPGTARVVVPVPGPGFPGEFTDGDRLAGTSDVGDTAEFGGIGVPMFEPNEFGSLSFMFRRGSVPIPPDLQFPIMGVDFLGGPLLDLDGDLTNGSRSLVPVPGEEAIVIPDSASLVDLVPDFAGETIELVWMDAISTNVGAPGIEAEIATTVVVLAGTENDATPGDPINLTIDTRLGDLVVYEGTSGTLVGVHRIEDLGYEVWQDSLNPNSSSADVLGTIQFLGTWSGWLVVHDPLTGTFPSLTGEGLGATVWPMVDTAFVGERVLTANGLVGGFATIVEGFPGDVFSVAGNGGTALTDFDGDLGAYFDQIVLPTLPPSHHSFLYLESAGFGVNNSFDPVFLDSIGYDIVIVASSECGHSPEVIPGDLDHNGVVDLDDYAGFRECVSGPGNPVEMGCEAADIDQDEDVDLIDFGGFQQLFGASYTLPDCEL